MVPVREDGSTAMEVTRECGKPEEGMDTPARTEGATVTVGTWPPVARITAATGELWNPPPPPPADREETNGDWNTPETINGNKNKEVCDLIHLYIFLQPKYYFSPVHGTYIRW